MKKKKILSVFLTAALFLSSAATFALADETQPVTISILHTNDQHGRVVRDDAKQVIGIDRIATIKKETPNSVLVDAGDTLHGLPLATLTRGGSIVELMDMAGYDYMTPGNHDFNYGYQRLVALSKEAGFKMLSANIEKDGAPLLQQTDVKEIGGIKVGFFGLTAQSTVTSALPAYVAGLTFADAVQRANQALETLQLQGAQVIVAITHLGTLEDEPTTSTKLAQAVPGIDVIIDGHSHTVMENGQTTNGVLIASAGNYENFLGKVTLTIDATGKVAAKQAALIPYADTANIEPAADVTACLQKLHDEQTALLAQTVGSSAQVLSSARAPGVRTQEMALGNLIADAYREAADAQISVVNGGDIRADLPKGTVTRGDILSILPFGNTLQVKKIAPATLKAALEVGVSGIVVNDAGEIDHEKSAQGRFPQVSGFSYTYQPTAEVGSRILSITLDDGTKLNLNDTQTQIVMSASNYIFTGGDGYSMLAELPLLRELNTADEALSSYVAAHSPATAPALGRITAVKAGNDPSSEENSSIPSEITSDSSGMTDGSHSASSESIPYTGDGALPVVFFVCFAALLLTGGMIAVRRIKTKQN